MATRIGLVLFVSVVALANVARADERVAWRYVADSTQAQLTWKSIRLSDPQLDEMRVDARFRGNRQQFAQIRYGTPNSTRMIVVIDQIQPSEFDLYIDRNRNRVLEPGERIPGSGRSRECSIPLEIGSSPLVHHESRMVRFRLGFRGKALNYATIGFVEGCIPFGDGSVRVRRVDGDGNGQFADARDRIWIDIDNNAAWDSFSEQFPYSPILTIGPQRFAVRGDAVGQRLELVPITGFGQVQLKLSRLLPGVTVDQLEAMLVGKDGSAFAISSKEKTTAVPAGRYAVATLAISLHGEADDSVWTFVFSDLGSPRPKTWFDLAKDQTVAVDPMGELSLAMDLENGGGNTATSGPIRIQPQLFTQSGLLINSGGRQEPDSGRAESTAVVTLRTEDGRILSTAQSGFA